MDELRSSDTIFSILATSRLGSPLKAAKSIGCAPSTVYRAIERLEKSLGVPVFDRLPSGWRPTDSGRRIVRLAETLEREIAEAEIHLLQHARELPGPLRISASDGLAEGYLAPILAEIARRPDGPTIDLIVDNQFADIARRQADLAIRPHHRPGEGLIGRRAGKLAHALYGAASLFGKSALPLSAADLRDLPRCILSPALDRHTSATWWTRNKVAAGPVSLIANTEMGLAGAIAGGAGIGILPCFLGDHLPGVRRLGAIAVGPPIDIWIVTHSAMRKNSTVRAVVQALSDAMKRDGAKLAGTASAIHMQDRAE